MSACRRIGKCDSGESGQIYIRTDYDHNDKKSSHEIINDVIKWINKTYNYHIVYNNCQYFTMKHILKDENLVNTKYPIAEFEKILYRIYILLFNKKLYLFIVLLFILYKIKNI